jgi:hypothetical protein
MATFGMPASLRLRPARRPGAGNDRLSARRALHCLVALALFAGCGSSTSFESGVYRDAHVAFRVDPVPAGWRSIRVSDADLVFRDAAHEASVLVNGRCIPEDGDAPLASLTEHLLMGTTERDFLVEETIPLDSREARHTVLKAKLDGVLMGYDIFVMKKNGCVYDLVYVGDPAAMQAGAPTFESFAKGFHTLAADSTSGIVAGHPGG